MVLLIVHILDLRGQSLTVNSGFVSAVGIGDRKVDMTTISRPLPHAGASI
jgi:hypothetical protein